MNLSQLPATDIDASYLAELGPVSAASTSESLSAGAVFGIVVGSVVRPLSVILPACCCLRAVGRRRERAVQTRVGPPQSLFSGCWPRRLQRGENVHSPTTDRTTALLHWGGGRLSVLPSISAAAASTVASRRRRTSGGRRWSNLGRRIRSFASAAPGVSPGASQSASTQRTLSSEPAHRTARMLPYPLNALFEAWVIESGYVPSAGRWQSGLA